MKTPPRPSPAVWLYFSFFLMTNLFLALGPFSITIKLWSFMAVLLVGLVLSLLPGALPTLPGPFSRKRSFLEPPLWLVLAFLALGVLVRFYKLDSIPGWPDPDESLHSLNATHLDHFGDMRPFYTCNQAPFLFTWLLAAWFKLFGPSPATLWLFTASLSALLLPLLYGMAGAYFPKGFARMLATFGALAWWGYFSGRNGNATILVPWAECSTFWILGKVLTSPLPQRRPFVGLLGLSLGIGSYTYPPAWGPMALGVFLLTLVVLWKQRSSLTLFLGVLAVCLTPLAFFAFQDHYGSYINSIRWGAGAFDLLQQLLISGSYGTGLFWGKMPGDYYGPYWGGLFDPLTASLFGMGSLFAWRDRQDPFWKCFGAAFFLALLPGILSTNLEFYRIFLVYPLVLVLAAWGCNGLAAQLSPRQRTWFLSVVLTAMAAFNLYHLLGPYQEHWKVPGPSWGRYRSAANARAFEILRTVTSQWGPGYLLQNFPSDLSDQSLTLASYPMDHGNSPLDGTGRIHWIAVVANDNYGPFLLKRFSGGRWIPLSTDLATEDGGLGLGIFPIGSIPASDLKAWMAVNDALGEVAYVFLNRPTGRDYSAPLEALDRNRDLVQRDPFLASCFWEERYYLHLQNGAFGDRLKKENFLAALNDLQQALAQGYPAAHLLNEWGSLRWVAGDKAGAKKAFEWALRSNPGFEPARGNLRRINVAH